MAIILHLILCFLVIPKTLGIDATSESNFESSDPLNLLHAVVKGTDSPLAALDLDAENTFHLSENCTLVLKEFSTNIENFSACALLHARPISYCRGCHEEFSNVLKSYGKMEVSPESCQKSFFRSDQLGIINIVYSVAKILWRKGNCENCFENMNKTEQFFKIWGSFNNCISANKSDSRDDNNTCERCRYNYVNLSAIYRDIVQKNYATSCMDIIDRMNITRHLWNDKLHCMFQYDTALGYPNLLTSALVAIMPVCFYLLSKNIAIIEDVKIVRPKRKNLTPVQTLVTTSVETTDPETEATE